MPFSLTWPYARMPFVVTRRRGAKIASQAAHVDENRPISGRLGRSRGRPILASRRVTDAFRDMLDPASRREDTRRDG